MPDRDADTRDGLDRAMSPPLHGVGAALRFAAGLVVVLGLTAMVMWPALTGPFIFDDHPNLQNLRFLDGVISLEAIGRYLAALPGPPHRPLAMLSFVIEDSAWPAMPLDFKRDNLYFHLIVGLLVIAFVRQVLHETGSETQRATFIALGVGLAWLLAPIQLSATMLVVQRMNILAAGFVLAGCISYLALLRGAERVGVGRACVAYAGATLCGVLAYLCKENGALLPLYLAVLNLTVLRPRLTQATAAGRNLIILASVAPLVLGLAYILLKIDSLLTGYLLREFTLEQRLWTQPRILFEYLGQIFFPRLSGQGLFHDNYPFSTSWRSPPSTLAAVLALAALASAAFALHRRFPMFAFAVLWFLAGHVMESTFIGLELYFEHRNYLPMIGPLLLAGVVLGRYWKTLPARVVAVAWLVLCATMTWTNARTWGDGPLQAEVWLQEHPDSPRAVQWAAGHMMLRGDEAGAQAVLADAVARMPHRTELQLQQLLLRCLLDGLDGEDKRRLAAAAAESSHTVLPPLVLGQLVREYLGGRCHGSLQRDDILTVAEGILRNPRLGLDPDTLGNVHYDLSRIYSWEHEFPRVRHHMELAHLYRQSPIIARELAIYALAIGHPDLALRFVELSNDTPQPTLKRWLHDVREQNHSLELRARAELAAQRARSNLPDG